eukprot:GHVU01162997.1.p1 GENE.GHVU01162997.1~~GHVU01162997.1.p1  ORF type:complete len:159 (-),score=7.12 GHVU01162997.1:295-771(-)
MAKHLVYSSFLGSFCKSSKFVNLLTAPVFCFTESSCKLEVRDFLCVIDNHPDSLLCKNRDDIRQFGLNLGLEDVTVQQLISEQASTQRTSMAAYDVITFWYQSQPDAPILDLVIALARLLSDQHQAVQDLVEGLLKLGIGRCYTINYLTNSSLIITFR